MIGPAQAAPRDDRNGRVEEGRGWKTERGDGGGKGEKGTERRGKGMGRGRAAEGKEAGVADKMVSKEEGRINITTCAPTKDIRIGNTLVSEVGGAYNKLRKRPSYI